MRVTTVERMMGHERAKARLLLHWMEHEGVDTMDQDGSLSCWNNGDRCRRNLVQVVVVSGVG